MDPKLTRVIEQVDALSQDRAEVARDRHTGRAASLPLPRLFHAYRDLLHPDRFFELREAFEGAATGSPRREELGRLCLFLAEAAVEARAAEAVEWTTRWESTFAPWHDEADLPVVDALRRIAREPVRARRLLLSRAVHRELEAQDARFGAPVEAWFTVAERLGFEGPLPLRAAFEGSADALQQECAQLLARTEDAYRDVLGYVVGRAEPTLRGAIGGAERADLERALVAPWTFGDLPRGHVLHALRRWIEDWGVAKGAGALEVDDADRSGKPSEVMVVAIRVPQRVFAATRMEAGVADTAALLGAYGMGLSWALRDTKAGTLERRLDGPAWVEAFGALFRAIATDAGWLERVVRLTRSQARELARLFAFHELTRLRAACAQLGFERWLLAHGPGGDAPDVYEAEHRAALRVSVPRGAALRSAQRPLQSAVLLRGARLAGRLPSMLRERFDEDYWRNPAAASHLRELAARPRVAQDVLGAGGEGSLLDCVPGLLRALGG